MKHIYRALSVLLCLIFCLTLFGCSKNDSPSTTGATQPTSASSAEAKTHFTVGCMPLNKDAVEAIGTLMEPMGYELEVVVFDGNNLPALALSNNEIDSLILNHRPWIETFNRENNTDLVMADGFYYASLVGLYSSKHATLEEIPNGAQIIVSNDPTNMDRALLLLESIDFLKLGEKSGQFYSILDIEDNIKNIQFVEVETTSTAGSYLDADATITFTSVMRNAGYDPTSYLVEDGKRQDYPAGLVVNRGNENEQWVKDLIAVTQTSEYEALFNEIFGGAYILFK